MDISQKSQWIFELFAKNFSTWYIVKSDLKRFVQVAPIIFGFMQGTLGGPRLVSNN